MLLRPLITNARFDEDALFLCLDEEAVHAHAYAVLLVRRTDLRPKRARNDAEHRAAVQTKLRVGHNLYSIISEPHQIRLRISDCGMRIEKRFLNPHSAFRHPQ